MASSIPRCPLVLAFSLFLLLPTSLAHRSSANRYLKRDQIRYHGGKLLTGNINLVLIWYGDFEQSTKDTVRNFIESINLPKGHRSQPTVGNWWKVAQNYQIVASPRTTPAKTSICLAKEASLPTSLGQILTLEFIKKIVKDAGGLPNSVAVLITAKDVSVHGLCTRKCQLHGVIEKTQPYIVVGNSELECPESCMWPFHASPYMPRGQVLQPPNGDAAADSIVVHLAAGLAEVIANPFNTGFYAGTQYKPIEIAGGRCKNVFGKHASPRIGLPGKVAYENGKAFNACGKNGQKFLLPAIWNPKSRSCYTLM